MFRASPFALAVALLPSIAQAETSPACAAPSAIGDGWSVSEPVAQQLDPALICAVRKNLEALNDANPHGVVIVRNGVVVYETYFTGPDRRWPQQHWREPLQIESHDARTKHDVQSITKSVVALLVGIAMDRGSIKNVDAPLLSFFPEYADLASPERQTITLRDLLTMRAGLDWPGRPYLSMARRVDAAPDPYRLVLEQPMVSEPGKRWRYNNGVAELVGGVVQKATGRPLDQFANDVLFQPLGITDWEWGRMASGNPGASWGLRLRPRPREDWTVAAGSRFMARPADRFCRLDRRDDLAPGRNVEIFLCVFVVARPVSRERPQHRVDPRQRLGRAMPQRHSEARHGRRSDGGRL